MGVTQLAVAYMEAGVEAIPLNHFHRPHFWPDDLAVWPLSKRMETSLPPNKRAHRSDPLHARHRPFPAPYASADPGGGGRRIDTH